MWWRCLAYDIEIHIACSQSRSSLVCSADECREVRRFTVKSAVNKRKKCVRHFILTFNSIFRLYSLLLSLCVLCMCTFKAENPRTRIQSADRPSVRLPHFGMHCGIQIWHLLFTRTHIHPYTHTTSLFPWILNKQKTNENFFRQLSIICPTKRRRNTKP